MSPLKLLATCTIILWTTGIACAAGNGQLSNDVIRDTLLKNPQIIFDALKGHEEQLYDMLQIGMEKKNKSIIRAGRMQQLKNPKKAKLHPSRPVWGNPNSKITIIGFADFQSSSSAKADKTILALLKKHPDVNYRFRHNPLRIHKMSRPAALYYEAAALQSHDTAKKLNHLILTNRLNIKKNGIKELDRLAIKSGADLNKIHRDISSASVVQKVDNDIQEARKLGLTASPVFLVNGVTLTGAVPMSEFEEIFKMIKTQKP